MMILTAYDRHLASGAPVRTHPSLKYLNPPKGRGTQYCRCPAAADNKRDWTKPCPSCGSRVRV